MIATYNSMITHMCLSSEVSFATQGKPTRAKACQTRDHKNQIPNLDNLFLDANGSLEILNTNGTTARI